VDGEIHSVVAAINAAWIAGRFDELRDYFHPDVVLAQPGRAKRMVGRDALIESYRDFMRNATIHSFTPGAVQVDGVVSTMPWEMDYTFEGERYQERGWDLLVFGKHDARWVVVWRTVVVER
jgi:hypothetical protein